MKHAGLLAHSPDGAALAFSEFCHLGQKQFGKPIHPDITLDYIAMGHALPFWDQGDIAEVRSLLATSIDRLKAAGAEFFFCADNTAHIALEMAGPSLAIPGLNLPNVVAAKAKTLGLRKVGILGTRFTMSGHIYPRAFGEFGINWLLPDSADRDIIDKIIFEELVNGIVTDHSRDAYRKIIDKLKTGGCDGVALVCTEIPLLINQETSSLTVLDSTRLISDAAFDVSIGKGPFPTWRGGPP